MRQINAYNPNNSIIPPLNTLTSDGKGGTYWAVPCTLGGNGAFNQVVADNVSVLADTSYNILGICTLNGIGSVVDSNTITLFGKGFTQFNVEGGNTLLGYSNDSLTPDGVLCWNKWHSYR